MIKTFKLVLVALAISNFCHASDYYNNDLIDEKLKQDIVSLVENNKVRELKALIRKNDPEVILATINHIGDEGLPILHTALINNSPANIIELLLKSGADPDLDITADYYDKASKVMFNKGYTAAHIAVKQKRASEKEILPILQILLDNETNFCISCNDWKGTAVMMAAIDNDVANRFFSRNKDALHKRSQKLATLPRTVTYYDDVDDENVKVEDAHAQDATSKWDMANVYKFCAAGSIVAASCLVYYLQ